MSDATERRPPLPAHRRRFLRTTLALGAALAVPPARAAAAGKVLFGFMVGPAGVPGVAALLQELQGKTEFDFGAKLSVVAGNAGALSLQALRSAPADGSTLLLAPSAVISLTSLLRKLPGIDPTVDLLPVASLSELSHGFVIGPAVPAAVTHLKDYIAWVRDNPMQAHYGVPGLGGVPHLLGASLAELAGAALQAVPYKGQGALGDDLAQGAIGAAIVPRELAIAMLVSGKMRLLAVSSQQRWPSHPSVATLRELGLIDVNVPGESMGLFASSHTPPDKVRALGAAVVQAMQAPAVVAAFAAAQLPTKVMDAPAFAAAIADERKAWTRFVAAHASLLNN